MSKSRELEIKFALKFSVGVRVKRRIRVKAHRRRVNGKTVKVRSHIRMI